MIVIAQVNILGSDLPPSPWLATEFLPTCVWETVVHLSLTFVLTLEFGLNNICFHSMAARSLKAHLKRPDT